VSTSCGLPELDFDNRCGAAIGDRLDERAASMSLYTWVTDWAELPLEPLGWMHSGIAIADGHAVY
jgi:hypothetical protein